MINFDDYTYENKTAHNSTWPFIPVLGGSGSGQEKDMHY